MAKRIYKYKCERCFVKWKSALKSPKQCPYCHRRNWNRPKLERKLKCYRCRETWKSNTLEPKTCAKCNNPNWNKKTISQIVWEKLKIKI